MTHRITEKMLESLVMELNKARNSPLSTYTKSNDGKFTSNIGNYHISYQYGGVSLHRIENNQGGVSDVLSSGHITKPDLYRQIKAYLSGIYSTQH